MNKKINLIIGSGVLGAYLSLGFLKNNLNFETQKNAFSGPKDALKKSYDHF